MIKFKVFDDIISPTYQDVFEELMSSQDLPWKWQNSMDYPITDSTNPYSGGYPQFNCDIFNNGQIFETGLYHLTIGLLSKIVDDIIPGYYPTRLRAILHTPRAEDIKHYPPHTDATNTGGVSAIYYPTDATGDTYLFNEYDINDKVEIDRFNHTWEPVDSVSPKKGRLITFPSNHYHAGSPTTSDRRMLININFFPK
mgnify:FL=1|tara:strand:+ start:115 stop:705 length:591 start_codon:yes stop_codon:yes gene_type:complete